MWSMALKYFLLQCETLTHHQWQPGRSLTAAAPLIDASPHECSDQHCPWLAFSDRWPHPAPIHRGLRRRCPMAGVCADERWDFYEVLALCGCTDGSSFRPCCLSRVLGWRLAQHRLWAQILILLETLNRLSQYICLSASSGWLHLTNV